MNEYTIRLCEISPHTTYGLGLKKLIKKADDPDIVVNHDGTSLLMKHVEGYEVFNALLKYDLDLDKQTKTGETVLIRAAKEGYEGFVKKLLKKGAKVDIQDNTGRTALLAAAASGSVKCAELILKYGADLHHTDEFGENALFYAVTDRSPEMIQFLIEKGISINHKNKEGYTALFKNIYNEDSSEYRFENLNTLVKAGADINMKNHKHETVLEIAVQFGFIKAVQYLLENGADIQDKEQNILTKFRKNSDHAKKILKLLNNAGAKAFPFIARYKTKFKCNSCGRMIAVNGPVEHIICSSCQTINTIDDIIWKGFIDYSNYQDDKFNVSYEGTNHLYIEMKRTVPKCSDPDCQTELNYKDVNPDSEERFVCKKCGKEYFSLPAPEFLKKFDMKGLKISRIICEEKETGKIGKKEFKTTAVQCVSCGAGMSFSDERPRLSSCEHCGTVQYVTDKIWKSLHPYKIRKPWFVFFDED